MRFLLFGLSMGCNGSENDPSTTTTDDTADTSQTVPQGFSVTDLQVTVHEDMGSILVATWSQTGTASTWLEFSVDAGEWLTSPSTEREAGAAEELALGAPFEAEVQLRVAWEGGETKAITATTDDLPEGAPVALAVEGNPSAWDAASPYVLLCMYGDNYSESLRGVWAVIIDRQGRVVWAKEINQFRVSLQTQLSYDGTSILIDQNSFWAIFDGGASSSIERVNIEGEVLESWDTPGLHHPFTELPDGTIAWGSVDGQFVDESLKTLSPDGTERTLWSCRDFLKTEADGGGPGAYCGSNTLFYNASTDTFLYSFFSMETIVEIDYKTGDTVRYFGHTGENTWAFDPPESAFWWQHGAHITEWGTLLVSTKGENNAKETILREYAIDKDNQTLIEVFSFGTGEGLYGDTMGEADYTISGNIQHNLGSLTRIREITPEGVVVWDVDWDASMLGRSSPVPDLYVLR